MGGWVKLCSMTIDELPFKQREFEKLYTSALSSPASLVPKYLAGAAEISNNAQQLPSPPPKKTFLARPDDANPKLAGNKPTLMIIDDPLNKQQQTVKPIGQ